MLGFSADKVYCRIEESKGFYGDFDVTVTVTENAITNVAFGDFQETPSLGGKALLILADEIVRYNTAGVDVVSGATVTSAVTLAAIRECLTQAGAPASLLEAPQEPEKESETIATQVLVIGSGAAGFGAAIAAAEAGAQVVMIEKQGVIGGSTITSAGIVYAALDEADVPIMAQYYQERAEGKADPEIVDFFAANSANTIQWLTSHGVEWMFTAPAGTAPEARANFSLNMTGASLIEPLERAADELGVTIMTNVTATELTVDGSGRVTGALAEGKAADYTFEAGAVVLATGGFDASEEMKQQYSPIAVGDFPLSSKGNTGDGIRMGMEVGAATEFKGGIIGFDFVDGSLPNSGQNGIAMGAALYVTGEGEFICPLIDYPITYTNLKASGAESFFGIYDAAGAENGDLAVSLGYGYKADTLEELAAAAGMDAALLAEAVATDEALANAPFYAVVVKPCTIGSMGGLKINTDAQVLMETGEAIGGLYAAGEVANGGLYYQEYPASGTSNCMSFTFGIEAGTNAAAEVK